MDSLYMAERCNDNRNPNSVLRMEDFLMYINKETAIPLINTGVMAVFCSIKCQRWDFNPF